VAVFREAASGADTVPRAPRRSHEVSMVGRPLPPQQIHKPARLRMGGNASVELMGDFFR
jgi:hypothetical protein